MADLKTTNIYGDAYINNKVGINTNTPATRLQIGQLSPTAATEGLQFGDDTGARMYRSAASTISIAGNFNASSGTITSTYGGFSSPGLILGDAQYGFYVASGNLYYKSAAGGNHYWRNIANNATTLALDNSGNLTALGNISAANLSGTNTGDQTVGNGTITIAAGTGIGVGTSNTFTTNQSGATTVTVTNSGVTSAVAGTGVGVSAATGAVTFSIGQAVGTGNTPTFAGATLNGQLNINHSASTSILRLYNAGSTVWNLGVGDTSGTNFNISADFGSVLINKLTGNFWISGSGISNYLTYHRTDITSLSSSATNLVQPLGTFDASNATKGPSNAWYNYFSSTHGNYLTSLIANRHRSSQWYIAYKEGPGGTPTDPTWYELVHTGFTGTVSGLTAATASYANTLNAGNSYTGVNFIATGYFQTNLGQIKSDSSFALLTTGNGAQSVSVKGILLGTSYDTAPGANEIRTTNNTSLYLNARGTGDIQFQTADSLKMMLLNNGNVGIGISSPVAKLHVIGDISGSGQVRAPSFYSNGAAGTCYFETLNIGTGVYIEGGANEGIYFGDSSRWIIDTCNAAHNDNADGELHFRDYTNSITRMLIQYSTGNIGMGITTPSASLHIKSTTSGATLLRTDGTNGTLFSVVDDLSDSLMSVNNSAGLPVLEVFADDRIVAGQYGQNDFVVRNNYVGIGTNNPTAKLYVTSSTSTPSAVFLGGNVGIGTSSPAVKLVVIGETQIQSSNAYTTHFNYSDSGVNFITTANGGYTDFRASSNNVTTMRVKGDGTVGIGTTSPSTALHVVGVISGSSFTGAGTGLTGTAAGLSIGGNAATATSAATWTTGRAFTIGSTAKTVDGSSAITWSLAEIGAAATNQTMYIGTTAVAINRTSSAISLTGVNIDGTAGGETLGTVTGRGGSTGTQILVATAAGQAMFVGRQAGAGYSYGSAGIFTAQSDNPNGTQNIFFQGYVSSSATVASGNLTFSIRADGQIYTTMNTATGIANNSFSVGQNVVGSIHIANGGGTSGNNRQAAITFQGDSTSTAQAGIYVSNNTSTGTAMGFATTDNYTTGPQLFMTATSAGVVNFPRARPTYAGNTILDTAYSGTVSGLSIGGNAATATTATTATTANALNASNQYSVTGITGSIQTTAVRETFAAVSSNTTVSIDLSTATVFNLSFTSTISAFNITNVNTSKVNSFTLITAPNGTAATIAWSFQTNGGVAANVKWSGTAPTATTTSGRFDVFSFVYDGTRWFGFTGGLNYN